MNRGFIRILPVLFAGIILLSCSPNSTYERRLSRELASGERNDTLFMGIYLGMSDKDFYTHCWKLNKEGLIRQGTRNMTVEYQLADELPFPATMNFYPEFGQGKIIELPVRYSYNGWAPWNKDLSSEKLLEDVLDYFKKSYGRGFITVKHPERGLAHIRIDGNRRITLYKEDDMYVWAVFKDMSVSGEIRSEK
jgi:hypothetical protein